jgi:antirestriction protein
MENQPHIPQGGENPYQQANSYGTDDPNVQASIEQARTEAADERRRNRARLERYVEGGMNADDAEALIEFEQSVADIEPPAVEPERLTDDQLIHLHITEALREERPIDHATARAIASQLHGGQASALYALASSGAVVDDVRSELDAWREDNATGVEVEPWLDALDEYLGSREDHHPVAGWAGLWPAQPERLGRELEAVAESGNTAPAEDDEAARVALFERISAAGVTTLGQVATVGTVEPVHAATDQDDEPDDFYWSDTAEWRQAAVLASDYEERRYSDTELDALFGEQPTEVVGSVDDLGWYGLIKHDGQPGGLILIQDDQGCRRVREVPTNDALDVQWAAVQQEYETFYEQRDAYDQATQTANSAPSGHNPQIWVASLSDYNQGNLYGVWLDATLDPDELENAVAFMLRNSPSRDAEEYAIFDADDFGGYQVGEYTNLKTVSRIAQGVAEHGPAFAEWVDLVGDQSDELLTDEAFRDHYEGEWDSLEDYVEYMLDETGFTAELERALAGLPEVLRRYVKVDVDGIAEEWAQGLHVVERGDGKVWVFDARG